MATININTPNFNTIPIQFKEVWTDNLKVYYINPEWTTSQLLQYITPQVLIDFGLSNFELVLAGQSVTIPEMAPALTISNNIRIKHDILGPEMRIISFYIRKLNYQYPQMANL